MQHLLRPSQSSVYCWINFNYINWKHWSALCLYWECAAFLDGDCSRAKATSGTFFFIEALCHKTNFSSERPVGCIEKHRVVYSVSPDCHTVVKMSGNKCAKLNTQRFPHNKYAVMWKCFIIQTDKYSTIYTEKKSQNQGTSPQQKLTKFLIQKVLYSLSDWLCCN